jgi:hypothetical protein
VCVERKRGGGLNIFFLLKKKICRHLLCVFVYKKVISEIQKFNAYI